MDYPFKRFEAPNALGHERSSSDGDDFVPQDVDNRDFARRDAALRPWQGQFRDTLFERYGAHCCISGCAVREALEAAHITPYLGEKSNDARNGLVLRSDLHTLFDRYLFGIDPSTFRVNLSRELASDPTYRDYDGKELAIGTKHMPSRNALGVHWRKFVKMRA
jgi:predicted restriction endonuclease